MAIAMASLEAGQQVTAVPEMTNRRLVARVDSTYTGLMIYRVFLTEAEEYARRAVAACENAVYVPSLTMR